MKSRALRWLSISSAAASPSLALRCASNRRRELTIKDIAYTLVIDPDGLKLTEKGRRKGIELKWSEVVSGDAGTAAALQASVDA